MFFNVLAISSLFITLATPSTEAETLTSTTEAVEISTRATSGFDSNVTRNQEQEWRSNQPQNQPEKVVNIDASAVHKYRRDGIENLPEHDYRRRYFLDFPEHYQYENELYHREDKHRQRQQYQQPYQQPYQQLYQQQHRNRDETYPVTVQGCPMADVARPYPSNMPFQNQGILRGWLAGSDWRPEDKRYESSYPLQVTTATPKVAPSYRNRDYTRYDFSRDKSGATYKSRYDPEAGVSATRDYSGIRDLQNPTWMQPYQPSQARNNRIVYYEYNLDDRRPGRCHPMDTSCGNNRWNSGGSGHHRFQSSDYYRNQQPYRPEGGREDSSQPDDYEDREGRGGNRQNGGFGYVYSIDLPVERAISPSTAYAYDMGFARKTQGYRHAPMPQLDTRWT